MRPHHPHDEACGDGSGKPGAGDAGVLNYIDLALAGAYADQQDFYRRGLAALDAHCRATSGKPFVQLSAAQQDDVIAALEGGKATGFTWPTAQAFFNTLRNKIVLLAARHAVPTMYQLREYVVAGGLASYGTDFTDAYRQVGAYAGRILKGAKPAELPVVQPTKFEFIINMKTAKALGLPISTAMQLLADEVIE